MSDDRVDAICARSASPDAAPGAEQGISYGVPVFRIPAVPSAPSRPYRAIRACTEAARRSRSAPVG